MSITPRQLDLIKHAAKLLPAEETNAFFRSVASRLSGVDAGDDAVRAAVNFILNSRGVAAGRAFLRTSRKERDHATTNATPHGR
jgi:hypothetical protein